VMLLVGSFFGRAGGLIFVGLVAAAATAIGAASEKIDDRMVETPLSAAQALNGNYDYNWGEYELDLTAVADPENLDGRTIHLTADAAELDVVVPDDMDVTVTGRVNGPGGMTIFDHETGGIDTEHTYSHDGGPAAPHLTLDLEIDFGHIDVRTR
jgi:hypothetical protein